MNEDFIGVVNEEINNTDNINYKIYLEELINFYKEPRKYKKGIYSYRYKETISYIDKNEYENIIREFTYRCRRNKQVSLHKNYSLSSVKLKIEAIDKLLKIDYSDKMFKRKLELQEQLDKLTKMTEEEREDECIKKQHELSEEYMKYMDLITNKVIEKLGVSEKVELNKDEETVKEFNGEELKIQESNEIKNEDLKKATDLILNCIKEAKEEILTEIKNNKK